MAMPEGWQFLGLVYEEHRSEAEEHLAREEIAVYFAAELEIGDVVPKGDPAKKFCGAYVPSFSDATLALAKLLANQRTFQMADDTVARQAAQMRLARAADGYKE